MDLDNIVQSLTAQFDLPFPAILATTVPHTLHAIGSVHMPQ